MEPNFNLRSRLLDLPEIAEYDYPSSSHIFNNISIVTCVYGEILTLYFAGCCRKGILETHALFGRSRQEKKIS
jgi:hypothetical protein